MRLTFTWLLTLGVSLSAFAQQSKKPLDHSVYDGWQSVNAERISNDGNWVLYAVTPQEGDASLVIRNVKNSGSWNVPRVNTAQFSEDSRFAVFLIKPFFQETRQARIKKKKPEDMPKDTLGIVALGTPGVQKIARVKSFRMPENGSGFVAYLMEKALPDTSKKVSAADAAATAKDGTDLVLKNLLNNTDRTFKYVTDYAFSRDGKSLAFVSTGSKKDSVNLPGLYLYNLSTQNLKKISSGKGQYKSLTFDDAGAQLAFLAEKGQEKAPVKLYDLYYFRSGNDSAMVIADRNKQGLPAKWAVSGDGRVFFSKNGGRLFFGTAPIPAAKDTSIVDFEVANVDVWHWQDDYLQTMQLRNLDRELRRSYLAVVHLNNPSRLVQLADEKLAEVTPGAEGNATWGLASTDLGNRIEIQWAGSAPRDYFLVNLNTGERVSVAGKIRGAAQMSPNGNYVVWFNRSDRNLYSYNIASKQIIQLNKGLNVAFHDELNDVPDDPGPYGFGGWTSDEKEILIYDRYDIWAFNPQTGASRNLTNGAGRSSNLTFRYRPFSNEDRFIDVKKPLILTAFNNTTKDAGFYSTSIDGKKNPQLIQMAPMNFSTVQKAKNADVYIYEKSNYQLSPDLYVSTNLKNETRLSAINPQQNQYNWGSAELVKWTTRKGYQAEGILYKPEDFDPNKKYPMIVYFYERVSDGLNSYIAPSPTPSRLNISFFVSNGYLVFTPDIAYEIGYPGRSAEEFINSGVEHLKKNAWVNGSKIGIQGQSWGGYQVAHLITRTDMYAAAWAGAPVVNMTSAYGGIRWESGMNRQFQYEKTQSRIGATLWEKPELYIENSPLFHFPKVNTPVVIMANDADGAVPWYQGIEMFTGLRRLGKPVWMLNYNNEAHNLVERRNRKDIQIREQQFFDHFLKGAPAAEWIIRGVPATEKGRNWGLEIVKD